MNNKLMIGGVILALVLSIVGIFGGSLSIKEKPIGASAGPEKTETQYFRAGYTFGGNSCYATSTTAAVGTLPNISNDVNCIDYTVNVADVTLTLMASTTAWMPQKQNEMRSLFIRNASTTATADIVIAAGTGINLKRATSSVTVLGDTGADNYARIDFVRQADSDVDALVTLFID